MDVQNLCKNYFSGLGELTAKNSNIQTRSLAALKVLSYLTIFLPLIFGIIQGVSTLANRKVTKEKGGGSVDPVAEKRFSSQSSPSKLPITQSISTGEGATRPSLPKPIPSLENLNISEIKSLAASLSDEEILKLSLWEVPPYARPDAFGVIFYTAVDKTGSSRAERLIPKFPNTRIFEEMSCFSKEHWKWITDDQILNQETNFPLFVSKNQKHLEEGVNALFNEDKERWKRIGYRLNDKQLAHIRPHLKIEEEKEKKPLPQRENTGEGLGVGLDFTVQGKPQEELKTAKAPLQSERKVYTAENLSELKNLRPYLKIEEEEEEKKPLPPRENTGKGLGIGLDFTVQGKSQEETAKAPLQSERKVYTAENLSELKNLSDKEALEFDLLRIQNCLRGDALKYLFPLNDFSSDQDGDPFKNSKGARRLQQLQTAKFGEFAHDLSPGHWLCLNREQVSKLDFVEIFKNAGEGEDLQIFERLQHLMTEEQRANCRRALRIDEKSSSDQPEIPQGVLQNTHKTDKKRDLSGKSTEQRQRKETPEKKSFTAENLSDLKNLFDKDALEFDLSRIPEDLKKDALKNLFNLNEYSPGEARERFKKSKGAKRLQQLKPEKIQEFARYLSSGHWRCFGKEQVQKMDFKEILESIPPGFDRSTIVEHLQNLMTEEQVKICKRILGIEIEVYGPESREEETAKTEYTGGAIESLPRRSEPAIRLQNSTKIREETIEKNAWNFAMSKGVNERTFYKDSYLRIIKDFLKDSSFANDPQSYLKNRISFASESLMVEEYFTNPEEIKKLASENIISEETKKRLLKLGIPKENAWNFAVKKEIDVRTFNKYTYFSLVEEFLKDSYFANDPQSYLKNRLSHNFESLMVEEYFTNPEEIKKLASENIISEETQKRLLKFAIPRENAWKFARNDNIDERTFNKYIYLGLVEKLLKDSSFANDPQSYLKKQPSYSFESLMVERYFTNSEEIKKLASENIISEETKKRLLKLAIKENAWNFVIKKGIDERTFNRYIYFMRLEDLLKDSSFANDPRYYLKNKLPVTIEGNMVKEFLTTREELQELVDYDIISPSISDKLLEK